MRQVSLRRSRARCVAGHYSRAATVLENLAMEEPLLSRFDMVFILLDASDEQRDVHLSEHVMALHSGGFGTIGLAGCGPTPRV